MNFSTIGKGADRRMRFVHGGQEEPLLHSWQGKTRKLWSVPYGLVRIAAAGWIDGETVQRVIGKRADGGAAERR
jgi:hypothetical protein